MGKDTHRDPRFTYNGRPVLIEGHRGYKGRFPENTLLSFDEAIKAGAGQLEFDIRAAGDGTVFVFHDANVDRTTNGSGPLSSLTYDEVKELDAGSWFGPGVQRGEGAYLGRSPRLPQRKGPAEH
ncbi:MAG: glycerophosphodiester phosphodiesterase family protein [Limnochordia bacterium]